MPKVASMPDPNKTTAPLVDNERDKTPRALENGPQTEEQQGKKSPKLAEVAQKVLAGEMSIAEAIASFPGVVAFLQRLLGNAAVDSLLNGDEADEQEDEQDDVEEEEQQGEGGIASGAAMLGIASGAAMLGGVMGGGAMAGMLGGLGLGLGLKGLKGKGKAGGDKKVKEPAEATTKGKDEEANEAQADKGDKTDPSKETKEPKRDKTASKKEADAVNKDADKNKADKKVKGDNAKNPSPESDEADKKSEEVHDKAKQEANKQDGAEGDEQKSEALDADKAEDKEPEGADEVNKKQGADKVKDGGKKVDDKESGGDEVPGGDKAPGGAGGAKETPVKGGDGVETTETVAPQPPPEPVVDSGPGGTMDEYMANNPDTAAEERVTSMGQLNGKYARQANGLSGKIALPPDKSWIDAVTPRQEWFKFKQGVLGKNKWTGQDRALDVMTRMTNAIDVISSAASKIGLAATISGAILTFLVPPVGAFLLSVGRVANAISAAMAVLKLITSIVKTVMLAVKVAKEKDPHKRMEMMQEMKQATAGAVSAGIEVIINKLTGGAKGGAGNAGGKAWDSTKSAFKGARDAGKGVIASSKEALKAGAGTFKEGLKTSVKEGVQKVKNLGVGGTLKSMGRGIKSSAKDTFVKPFQDLGKAFTGAKIAFKDMTNKATWKAIASQGGGGMGGYFKGVNQMNFPNATKATGWKDKIVEGAKDLTDAKRGGYATQIHMGMNSDIDPKERAKIKGANPHEIKQQEISNYAGGLQTKAKAFEDAKTREDKEKLLKPDDPAEAKHVDLSHLDDSTVDVMFNKKKKETLAGYKLVHAPTDPLGAAKDVYGAYAARKNGGDWGDVVKSTLGHTGAAGTTGSKLMVNANSSQDKAAAKKSFVAQVQAANDANTTKAADSIAKVPESSTKGVTQAKAEATMGPLLPLLSARKDELKGLLAMQGKSGAGGADESGGALPPPPPAPPEGTLVPTEASINKATAERGKIGGLKAQVQKDIDKAKQLKEQAIAGDAKLAEYGAGLDKQAGEIAQQKSEADKDKVEITTAGAQIKEGGAKIASEKGKAEGEKGKVDAKASEGSDVKAKPDDAKYEAEKRKKAEADKKKWDREYARAGKFKRLKMKAKKWLFSIANLVKKAAKWIWKKMIAPAIKAVKAALGKVMNFLTNMMMKGIMSVVKLFLSEEEKARLDDTFTEMKKMEAEQAKQAAAQAEQSNTEVKLKLTKAQTQAKAKIDTCQANIKEGTGIIESLDANDQALASEIAKMTSSRSAFMAQYKPYFDWVKLKEEHDAKTASGGGGGGGAAGTQPHPADKPLDPKYGQALSAAADVVSADSQTSETEVAD
ncbi:MAG: hypothetical protein CSA66_04565, partial [Proteobacteria bacterium]